MKLILIGPLFPTTLQQQPNTTQTLAPHSLTQLSKHLSLNNPVTKFTGNHERFPPATKSMYCKQVGADIYPQNLKTKNENWEMMKISLKNERNWKRVSWTYYSDDLWLPNGPTERSSSRIDIVFCYTFCFHGIRLWILIIIIIEAVKVFTVLARRLQSKFLFI